MSNLPIELATERFILTSPVTVFHTWTEKLEYWWRPKPWTTELLELNLVPGGRSAMIMRGPDGEEKAMESAERAIRLDYATGTHRH